MKFKARIVVSVLCSCIISTSVLILANILYRMTTNTFYEKCLCNNSGDNHLPSIPVRSTSKTVSDHRMNSFKRDDTEQFLDSHAQRTKTEIVHGHTDFPMGVKVGTLVKVVRENGTTEVQQRVGNIYHLLKRIGVGIFGHIYLAVDTTNGEKVAIKIDRSAEMNSTVSKESIIYRILQGGEGFLAVRWSGREGSYNVLVIDLLGPNLQTYFELCRYKFSLQTALLLADQMISRLEYLHYKGFIHRDLSPGNFAVGQDKKRGTLYNIDFGLSERYRDPNTARHVPYRHVGFTGTDRYCSLSAHEGYQQSRRDDMEALGYIFVYFLKGQLPWQRVKTKVKSEKVKQVLQVKQSITIDDLCKGLPAEFSVYLNITRSLKFEEEPDYTSLRNLFQNALKRQNVTTNYIFDWDVVNGTCKSSQTQL